MGAQLRVYKQKIASAQTTKKITKAMELIAASRIQKAMARVRASSPFARAVTRAVSAVATHSNVQHPLTTEREVIRLSAVVIFASDGPIASVSESEPPSSSVSSVRPSSAPSTAILRICVIPPVCAQSGCNTSMHRSCRYGSISQIVRSRSPVASGIVVAARANRDHRTIRLSRRQRLNLNVKVG